MVNICHRRFSSFFFLLAFALTISLPAWSAELLSQSLSEYRLLSYKINAFREIRGADEKAFPALDYVRQQYEANLEQLALKKREILQMFGKHLEDGREADLLTFCRKLNAITPNDSAKRDFEDLAQSLREKVAFEALAERQTQSRSRFLETIRAALADRTSQIDTKPRSKNGVPIYISFLWHMHQPIYWPYEDVVTTHNRGVYSYSLKDIFASRHGPYNWWPHNAVKAMADAGLPWGGAQVSFSGSLIENLNHLRNQGIGFDAWDAPWKAARKLKTHSGKPRLELIGFGYHHPLMALIDYTDIRRQIRMHRETVAQTFGADVPASRGLFPPENAFAEWMIPALVDEQVDWVLVDNIHFNRACRNYPWIKGENLMPPNPGEQTNPDHGEWRQLNGLWAPSKVSGWACRPHFVEQKDPITGTTALTPDGKPARLIAVPTERYLGNEDGRGGFGALNYEMVMSQFESLNTDPKHPILLVLHHDGDNYGGGTEGYYHANFQRFVEWAKANPDRFVPTTIQDYLDRFPPDPSDVIHVEPGSWSGADNGDPEFQKWNGDPDPKTGYSPDRNSWGVLTATRNLVQTAESMVPSSPLVEKAWKYLLVAETSCYEYWDGTEMWDSHPTRACNQAAEAAHAAIHTAQQEVDRTPPTIYLPQREPYNPGGMEWGSEPMPTKVTFWTYVHDMYGLRTVELQYAPVPHGGAPIGRAENWKTLPMQPHEIPAQTNPKPLLKAAEYRADLDGFAGKTVAYRVRAVDNRGNTAFSPTQYVFIGTGAPTQPDKPCWSPVEPTTADTIVIRSDRPGFVHWGINGWKQPPEAWWPAGTKPWTDGKSVETPMVSVPGSKDYEARLGAFSAGDISLSSIDFVFHYTDGSWGKDRRIIVKKAGER